MNRNLLKNNSLLKDESLFEGSAQYVYYPSNLVELETIVAALWDSGESYTVRGAGTGVCGAASPQSDALIIMDRFKSQQSLIEEDDNFYLEIDAGYTLAEAKQIIKKAGINQGIVVNPSENSACLGGIFSTNAMGSNQFRFGSFAEYVVAIDLILPQAKKIKLIRGESIFCEGQWISSTKDAELQSLLTKLNQIKPLDPKLNSLCTRALAFKEGMDLLDLVAGSEGMLGIVYSLKIRLVELSQQVWGIMSFFATQEDSFNFAKVLLQADWINTVSVIEYFDHNSLILIEEHKKQIPLIQGLADFPENCEAIYFQIEGNQSDEIDLALESALLLLEEANCKLEWCECGAKEVEIFANIRHFLPEICNSICERNQVRKLAADFTLPSLVASQNFYSKYLDQYNYALFGHIGNHHLHLNFMAEDQSEYDEIFQLMRQMVEELRALGGFAFSENGVGKAKQSLYLEFEHPALILHAQNIKKCFDKSTQVNPRNYFSKSTKV